MSWNPDETLEEATHLRASAPLSRRMALLLALVVAAAVAGYLAWLGSGEPSGPTTPPAQQQPESPQGTGQPR